MIDVSVVIPTRDRPDQLRCALESVKRQQGCTIECLVVDDGPAINRAVVQTVTADQSARYLTTGGGRGGGAARNEGIQQAKGQWIAFLDDDDTWSDDKLNRQISYMRSHSVELSYTGITVVGNHRKPRYSFRLPKWDDQYRSIMRKNFIGTTSTFIALRNALNAVDGFDSRLPALQDYDLYIRLLRRFKTGWIDAPLTQYFDDDQNRKVSTNREHFVTAVHLLREKYRNDIFYPLLNRSFRSITLLKCLRSRRFLLDTLQTFFMNRDR